ncbi:MAG: nucleotidyltransferase domain-containing protein [Anaerolineae bacterium]|nr:nucleotidyltransferase domain-containing protein [Anaerolineae bacterium]
MADFCQRWHIRELALFGSVLRDDFNPDSDVDILATFTPEADWSLFDHVRMEEELSHLLNRPVDLLVTVVFVEKHVPQTLSSTI